MFMIQIRVLLIDITKGSNRRFPSSKNSHFQNEAKCKIFVVKMNFSCTSENTNRFHIMGLHLASL